MGSGSPTLMQGRTHQGFHSFTRSPMQPFAHACIPENLASENLGPGVTSITDPLCSCGQVSATFWGCLSRCQMRGVGWVRRSDSFAPLESAWVLGPTGPRAPQEAPLRAAVQPERWPHSHTARRRQLVSCWLGVSVQP